MKYPSDDSNDKRPLAAYIAIAFVVVFCLFVLITGLEWKCLISVGALFVFSTLEKLAMMGEGRGSSEVP